MCRYEGKYSTLNSFHDTGRSTLISRDRRRFLGGIAASYAGLAGTAIASSNPLHPSDAGAHAALHEPQALCGRSKVLASDEATVVETGAGKIRGFKRNGSYIFKGVPYGASTSGTNRFMPPKSPEPWSGIRNALQYGRVLHRGAAATVAGEDCLRLNLWTPETNGSHKRPVMVYMHGGGFSGGSGHDLLVRSSPVSADCRPASPHASPRVGRRFVAETSGGPEDRQEESGLGLALFVTMLRISDRLIWRFRK